MAKRTNYDSEFCGSLPLQHINVVQAYGCLLVLSNELHVLQASENCTAIFGQGPQQVTGGPLAAFSDVSQLKDLQTRFSASTPSRIPLTLTIGGKKHPAIVHFTAELILLEIEIAAEVSERAFTQVFEEVKYAMAAIEAASTVEEASSAAVREIRRLTGFDGVMMYRFDDDWNGTVIAEEKEGELEHYLGHTFPASDVPRQARELYLKNPYRLIPDRQYSPVRLFPVINPLTSAFTDLSGSNLRGVAAVHLEYLKNMNVSASMSIRVIYNNTLWGLIACHHQTPHYLNFELCSVCELISTVVSNRISAIVDQERYAAESELQRQQTALIAQVYAEADVITGLMSAGDTNILSIFRATGAAAVCRGDYHTIGRVPDRDVVENLSLWLHSKAKERVFSTDSLPEVFEEAVPQATIASGLLAIPVDPGAGEYILVFRPEVVKTINWGGDPSKTIDFDPDGTKYHPRASFKIWQEQVHHTSAAWNFPELETAENLRSFIYEYRTKKEND